MKYILNAISLVICFAIASYGISFQMNCSNATLGWLVLAGNVLVSGVTMCIVIRNMVLGRNE